jgi:hypothetical protein
LHLHSALIARYALSFLFVCNTITCPDRVRPAHARLSRDSVSREPSCIQRTPCASDSQPRRHIDVITRRPVRCDSGQHAVTVAFRLPWPISLCHPVRSSRLVGWQRATVCAAVSFVVSGGASYHNYISLATTETLRSTTTFRTVVGIGYHRAGTEGTGLDNIPNPLLF